MTAQLELSKPMGHRVVTEEEIAAFARLTGDDARIHLDAEFARANGLPGPIAQGLLGASWALGALTQNAPERMGAGEPGAWLCGFSVRFTRMVVAGDTLSFRWRDSPPIDQSSTGSKSLITVVEIANQREEVVSSGEVTLYIGSKPDELSQSPARWLVEPPSPIRERTGPPAVYFAEDVLEYGPRGEVGVRSVSEADVVSFAEHTGELNPLYLNSSYAEGTRCGSRITPPMLTFCLGFATFLHELLTIPMPSAGFAGHLGDTWHCYRPVSFGDSLRVAHQPLSCARTRSRPEMAVVRFGLQVINQDDVVVQDGEVSMMIPGRPRR